MSDFFVMNENNGQNGLVKGVRDLLSIAKVENGTEALSVFLHACMLDVDFLPVGIEESDIYKSLSEEWNTQGALKFHYYHKTCLKTHCWMTCIPLYSYLAVHGTLDDGNADNVSIKLNVSDYLNAESNLIDVENIFTNPKKLERKFKDEFCYPLIALIQEKANCDPSFGFSITVDEIKLHILQLLPVESIVVLSTVNKDFNRVANFPFLWKYLLERDFGLVDVPTSTSTEDYKELYKKEYLKKKQRARKYVPISDNFHYPHPHIFPTSGPLLYVDPRRDLDPALQQAFPHLRDRFSPNWILPPYDYFRRFM